MDLTWLNYHHLYYFWTVAREGSIAKACSKLNLTQPTISSQIRRLEEALGETLFNRVGRGLVLTDVGQIVYRYAEEIFSLGQEMVEGLRGRSSGRPLRLAVGVADVLPKLIAYRILAPVLEREDAVQINCQEGKMEYLLADLALHRLDLVLTDTPMNAASRVRAFNHFLGSCGVSLFAHKSKAAFYRKGFPDRLKDAPFLLPTTNNLLRRDVDQWFASQGIRPRIVGEFQDSALIKAFGHAGVGLFFGPSAIEAEIKAQHDVQVVERIEEMEESYYAISVERRIKHPAVATVVETARSQLFEATE
ncbi:MAG: LysR family transcriptional activator of nhaA [Candidatus Latescibacterota bacterium]|jgi:LysR family transcriptional activator of nhaA